MTGSGRRGGLVLPAILVAIGVVALLVNAGLVPAQALARLVDMWPLVLIVIGIDMVLRATTRPAAAARLGLVTVAVACAVALVYASVGSSLNVGERTAAFTASIGELHQATLEMAFGGADIDVRYGNPGDMGDTLYTAQVTYTGSQQPTASLDRATGTVSLALAQHGLGFGTADHRRADVVLNPKMFWDVSLSGGATHATMALGTGTVRGIEVSGGASSIDLTLPPAQAATTISISGGANSVRVHRPGTAIRVEVTGGAGNLSLDGRSSSGFGDLNAESAGYSAATARYLLTVSGGANSVTVDSGG